LTTPSAIVVKMSVMETLERHELTARSKSCPP